MTRPLRPTTILRPAREVQAYALIIRATWERGAAQADALEEMQRRGLWLDPAQRQQAGLT